MEPTDAVDETPVTETDLLTSTLGEPTEPVAEIPVTDRLLFEITEVVPMLPVPGTHQEQVELKVPHVQLHKQMLQQVMELNYGLIVILLVLLKN